MSVLQNIFKFPTKADDSVMDERELSGSVCAVDVSAPENVALSPLILSLSRSAVDIAALGLT